MRRLFIAATSTALMLAPAFAWAQTASPPPDSVSGSPSASDMKGPPNANGYGTDTGLDKGSTVVGGAGSSGDQPASASGMKGSPNASGYSK